LQAWDLQQGFSYHFLNHVGLAQDTHIGGEKEVTKLVGPTKNPKVRVKWGRGISD
jgi:hypothetical protein